MGKRKNRKKERKGGKPHSSGPHHIVPQSRGGTRAGYNMFRGIKGDRFWPPETHGIKHGSYHALYANMMPSEVIAYHKKDLVGEGGLLDRSKLAEEKQITFFMMWGVMTSIDEINQWLTDNFLTAEHSFLEKGGKIK